MKKTVIMLILALGLSKVQAQIFTKYADTANYLIHEIKYKKNLYVGKPLSVLLDSLKIQPVDVWSSGGGKRTYVGVRVFFEFNFYSDFSRSHYMILKFDPSATVGMFNLFFPSVGHRGSMQDILNVYKNLIVTDVSVKDYTEDEPVNPDVHY